MSAAPPPLRRRASPKLPPEQRSPQLAGSTTLFWLEGMAVPRAAFAGSVAALAERLPSARYAINLCENRFAFACAFVATIASGRINLLPANSSVGALAALRASYPDSLLLSDRPMSDAVQVERTPAQPLARGSLPEVSSSHTAALVFTSGSTGEPLAHLKTWRLLQQAGISIARRLFDDFGPVNILATVPHHHMYGLELCLAVPLAAAHAASIERPVFPDDVRRALSQLPAPRVLVTTPVHIRALITTGVRLPALAAIVSATAPLPQELALQAERQFAAPMLEIYGSTETGSIATRRTLDGARWHLLDGAQLEFGVDGEARVRPVGGEIAVALQDRLEVDGDGFRLLGRTDDMLKVGGKRASIADLTSKLAAIPGVVDAVVFQPAPGVGSSEVLQRPAALVVAPGLSENEILAALGRMIDPVFLPRPLRKVAALPRDSVGKLPRLALQALLGDA